MVHAYTSDMVHLLTSVLQTILQKLLENLSTEVGSPVKIESFFRMEMGEGIQR